MSESVRTCELHPSIQANLECELCHRAICPVCRSEDRGGVICLECYVPGALEDSRLAALQEPVAASEPVARPRGLTVLGVFLIVSGVMPLLAPHEPKSGYSMVLVGFYLTGSTARAAHALNVIVSTFLGIGILKAWRSAWPLAIGYFGLLIANTVSIVLIPSLTERWLQALPPGLGQFSRPEVYFALSLHIAIHVAILRYVYRKRDYFGTTAETASSNH